LDLLEREGINYMFAVPAVLAALARHPSAKGRDWRRLKVINVGGAPIADDTALTARSVFGDVLYQVYGQTEAVPITMIGPRQWFAQVEGSNPLRSAGRPLVFAAVTVEDLGAITEEDVIEICRERLGSYKKPSKIVLQTEPLPRTPVGKLARKVLREPFWQGVDRRVSGA